MGSKKSIQKCNSNSEKCNLSMDSCDDPLQGLGDEIPLKKIYKFNRIVFADPLNITKIDENGHSTDTDVEESENITIRRRAGKRKKLFVHLHDNSNLTCSLQSCTKTFSTVALLKAHIRKVHYSEKRFTCEVCGAGFSAGYLLRRHSAVHGKEKVQCPVCKKMLSLRTSLAVHLRSHSDTRQHGCPVCGKRFLRRSTLNVHSAVHGERTVKK